MTLDSSGPVGPVYRNRAEVRKGRPKRGSRQPSVHTIELAELSNQILMLAYARSCAACIARAP